MLVLALVETIVIVVVVVQVVTVLVEVLPDAGAWQWTSMQPGHDQHGSGNPTA